MPKRSMKGYRYAEKSVDAQHWYNITNEWCLDIRL